MDLGLKDRKVLVTGSTKGIGFAIAREFLSAGAEVILHGRGRDQMDHALHRLEAQFGATHVRGVIADGSRASGIESLIEQAGDIDILINNLGVFEQKDFASITDDDWLQMFETNVMSGIRLSRYYLPKLLLKNDNGRILFVSSECGQMIPPDMIHYGVTKTAEIALARGMAELTKGTTVTVNSILPGPTYTEGVEVFVKAMAQRLKIEVEEATKEFFSSYRPSSLIQRFIDPAEVAATTVFFASPRAAASNGAAIRVEGGTVRAI